MHRITPFEPPRAYFIAVWDNLWDEGFPSMRNRRDVTVGCLVVVGALVSMSIGCGESDPDLYKVSGTLTHNGEPIPKMEVVFLPEDTSTKRESFGLTDSEGHFVMKMSSRE